MSTQTIDRHRRSGGAISYPMHHVLGIVPRPQEAGAIRAELRGAGFAEEAICVLFGEEGCCFDAEGARHGPLVHLLRAWQHFTPEYEHLAPMRTRSAAGRAWWRCGPTTTSTGSRSSRS